MDLPDINEQMKNLVRKTSFFDFKKAVFNKSEYCVNKRGVFVKIKDQEILLEKDPVLYRLLDIRNKGFKVTNHLVVEPTMECNLKCSFCFTHNQPDSFDLTEFKKEIRKYKNRLVSISGGEPTLYKELPELIKLIAKNNIPLLATNGLLLADEGYVKELKACGLKHVTFAFNGFSEKTEKAINGKMLLETKLKAIDNLSKNGFTFLLSMLLVRGVNEAEIEKLIQLALKYPENIREVRIRVESEIGKNKQNSPYFLSEVLTMFEQQIGISKKAVLRELHFKKIVKKLLLNKIVQKPCGFSFFICLNRGTLKALSEVDSPIILKDFLLKAGSFLINKTTNKKKKELWFHRQPFLKISLRRWPGKETIDKYHHYENCGSRYIYGHKAGLPVCYANFLQYSAKYQSV